MRQIKLILAALLLISPFAANADLILQDTFNRVAQIQFHEQIGQSFTAEDANVSIAFYFFDFNSSRMNLPLTMYLLDGNDPGFPVLDTVTLLLTPGARELGYVDFDFSSTNLVVSSSYTALIDAQNSRWAIAGTTENLYVGGRAYDGEGFFGEGDLRFRVTPTSVPEPGTLALFTLGLLGIAARRRRKV